MAPERRSSRASPQRPHLLTLPYDVRHLIYQRLFPPGEQLYLQAWDTARFRCILPEPASIPVALLRTCRQLHAEGSEYLYNAYLYNIIGSRGACLTHYAAFSALMERYSRGAGVRVDAFGNGEHSATVCLSLQAGSSKTRVLRRRRRGRPVEMRELEREAARGRGRVRTWRWPRGWLVGALVASIALLAVWLAAPSSGAGSTHPLPA